MSRSGTRVVSNRRIRAGLALLPLLAALAPAPAPAAKGGDAAKAQLAFGVDMARRGLWNEALFRFEQAKQQRPNDPSVLNNLAVAYEAVGRFDDADAAYRAALQLAPGHRDIKKNATRFREFLQSFRGGKPPAAPGGEEKPREGGA
jgi:Flp pilus assembly protein TadD